MDGMHRSSVTPELALPAGFLHPAFAALAAATEILVRDIDPASGIRCPAPGTLLVSPAADAGLASQAMLRFGLELAWLSAISELKRNTCLVLAGRAAGGFLACVPGEPEPAKVIDAFAELAAEEPPPPLRLATIAALLRSTGVLAGACGQEDFAEVHSQVSVLWELAAACETLIVAGGDDRLRLDPATCLNRYGCTPWPRPGFASFASSTASGLSADGLQAAEAKRQRLLREMIAEPARPVLDRHVAAAGNAILDYFDATNLADALLTASGTDAALVLTALLQAGRPDAAVTSILMSPAETGSGVPEAVCARHFASCTPSGDGVAKGALLHGAAPGTQLVTIGLRDDDGTPREQSRIARDCDEAIKAGIALGHVVLHAIDGSKTGLSAPDRESCIALSARYGASLDIVIDACQARIEPELVRFYLTHGFPVMVTGSKFFGAPGFCGAILFPKARLRRIVAAGGLPHGLSGYVTATGGAPQRRCPGLLLRWEAALHDMRRFKRLGAEQIRSGIDRFGAVVRSRVLRDNRLSMIAAPRPPGFAWSGRRTVYTFALHEGGTTLGMERLRAIYLAMGRDLEPALPGCQIGQPVSVGEAGLAGLRVALSAGHLIRGDDVAAPLAMVFTKLRLLLDNPRLMG